MSFQQGKMKRNLCAILVLTLCLASHWSTVKVDAFGVPGPFLRIGSSPYAIQTVNTASNALQAEDSRGSRRGFIATVKRLFLGAGTMSTLGRRPLPVFAEEIDGSKSGSTVEIQVTNLGGEPDSKGTIKIQLKPEWAPRGVARFEVSVLPSGDVAHASLLDVIPFTSDTRFPLFFTFGRI